LKAGRSKKPGQSLCRGPPKSGVRRYMGKRTRKITVHDLGTEKFRSGRLGSPVFFWKPWKTRKKAKIATFGVRRYMGDFRSKTSKTAKTR